MIFESLPELKERIETVARRKVWARIHVTDDTSNYMNLSTGTVLRMNGNDYFIRGEAREGRFGIGDQPKYWVKYAVDLTTGQDLILKLVFHEKFTTSLGPIKVHCTRDPDKESEVLRVVEGDSRFMQGRTEHDVAGNNVRIIEMIDGGSFFHWVAGNEMDHEEYYHDVLPGVFDKLQGCVDAMAKLHDHGLQHGDIRNDHILIERGTGAFRWIDFDYTTNYPDYDIFSMGNILTYATARGIVTCRPEASGRAFRPVPGAKVTCEDALLFYPYRLANLRKHHPYISQDLNDLLLCFSAGATNFFEDFRALARVMREVRTASWSGA